MPGGALGLGPTESQPEMRHEERTRNSDIAETMEPDEITFEDLLDDDERGCAALPQTFGQLLAEGFPRRGGLAQLAEIERMVDPEPRFAAVQQGYLRLLEQQRRAR